MSKQHASRSSGGSASPPPPGPARPRGTARSAPTSHASPSITASPPSIDPSESLQPPGLPSDPKPLSSAANPLASMPPSTFRPLIPAKGRKANDPYEPGLPPRVPIVLVDLKERAIAAARGADLAVAQQEEPLAEYLWPARDVQGIEDPFFLDIRDRLAANGLLEGQVDHVNGRLPSQAINAPLTSLNPGESRLAAICGLMEIGGTINPNIDSFSTDFTTALTLYNDNQQLFARVLDALYEAGRVPAKPAANYKGSNPPVVSELAEPARSEVRAEWWAAIAKKLIERGISAADAHLDEVAEQVLVDLRTGEGGISPSTVEIDLPSLEDSATVEIIPDNLKALQAVYFAGMLEQLKVFQVVDKLVEMFTQGMLPLGKGPAGDILFERYRNGANGRLLTEPERWNFYARVGIVGGGVSAPANAEFNELWIRFVSAVSSYVRQLNVDSLLRSTIPAPVNREQVRRSGRDLAGNLSLHGYGIAFYAATSLQSEIKEIIRLLGDAEVKNAFGARDMFQVIDQVATLELGGARNSVRYRTMASTGAIIIRWLANHRGVLTSSNNARVLDDRLIRSETTAESLGKKATVDPTDFDLVNACEQWLAVTGTSDESVEEYAQPSEPPMMTSRPIQIPAAARDLLDSVGIAAGLSAQTRNGKRQPAYGR